jgi:hypothetical protein
MKSFLATLGLATVLLGACAHDNLARPECAACHRRCDDELRDCRARRDAECDDRRRGCEDRCHVQDECR